MTEIIHNGSLMVDDLEDKSFKRRGDLCTYLKYGEDVAVNAGNFMYFAPIIKVGDFVKDPLTQVKVHQVFQQELNNIHFG